MPNQSRVNEKKKNEERVEQQKSGQSDRKINEVN